MDNRKIVDCKDCAYQYDCERTYLGCCSDGKEWGEEDAEDEDYAYVPSNAKE
jgi:hypothetical protein